MPRSDVAVTSDKRRRSFSSNACGSTAKPRLEVTTAEEEPRPLFQTPPTFRRDEAAARRSSLPTASLADPAWCCWRCIALSEARARTASRMAAREVRPGRCTTSSPTSASSTIARINAVAV